MSKKPRHIYEVTVTWADLEDDAGTISIDTTGDLDFSFRMPRETFERLASQIVEALARPNENVQPH